MPKLNTIPAEMLGKTNDELMEMSFEEILEIATKYNCLDALSILCDKKSKKKKYPRVLKPSKKPELNGKLTYQADYTAQPEYVMSPLGFFEIKAQFIHDICCVPRVEKAKEETFRDKIKAAAKAAAAKSASTTPTIDAMLSKK